MSVVSFLHTHWGTYSSWKLTDGGKATGQEFLLPAAALSTGSVLTQTWSQREKNCLTVWFQLMLMAEQQSHESYMQVFEFEPYSAVVFLLLWPPTSFHWVCGTCRGYSTCVCVCVQCVCVLLSPASVQGPEVQQLTSALRPLLLWLPGNPCVFEAKEFILLRKVQRIGGNCMKCGWSCQHEMLA